MTHDALRQPNPWPGRKVLELGTGRRPMKNATHHDRVKHGDWIDVAFDLDTMPWPEVDAAPFDVVVAYDVLEHVRDVLGFVNEAARLLAPGGLLVMRAAAHDNPAAYIDPTHLHFLTEESMSFFDRSTPLGEHYGSTYRDTLSRPLSHWTVVSAERTNPDSRFPDTGDWLFTMRLLHA